MINVSIIGAFTVPNFGDQLLLKVLVDKLRSIYSGKKIKFQVPFFGENIEKLDNVEYGGEWKALSRSTAVIFGGGGYFGETPHSYGNNPKANHFLDRNAENIVFQMLGASKFLGKGRPLRASTLSFLKYEKISKFCIKNNIPTYISGTGLGPVTSLLGKKSITKILDNAESIYLRDSESVEYAKILSRASINETSDIVLSLIRDFEIRCNGYNKFALHVGQVSEENKIFIYKLCDFLAGLNLDITVITDSFDASQVSLSESLREKYQFKLKAYEGSVQKFIESYNDFDCVITTKLHAGILAYSMGLLPFSLPAHPKSKRFYKQVGMNKYCNSISDNGLEQFEKIFIKAINSPEDAYKILS